MLGTREAIELTTQRIGKTYSKVTILKLMKKCSSFVVIKGCFMVDEAEFTDLYLHALSVKDCFNLLTQSNIRITLNETRQLIQANTQHVRRGRNIYINKESFNEILKGLQNGKS